MKTTYLSKSYTKSVNCLVRVARLGLFDMVTSISMLVHCWRSSFNNRFLLIAFCDFGVLVNNKLGVVNCVGNSVACFLTFFQLQHTTYLSGFAHHEYEFSLSLQFSLQKILLSYHVFYVVFDTFIWFLTL